MHRSPFPVPMQQVLLDQLVEIPAGGLAARAGQSLVIPTGDAASPFDENNRLLLSLIQLQSLYNHIREPVAPYRGHELPCSLLKSRFGQAR